MRTNRNGMRIFTNNNGIEYGIIEQQGDYALLVDIERKNSYHPYVVTWGLDIERGEWAKGRYRATEKEAIATYLDLVFN